MVLDPPGAEPVTLEDVARAAGVSRSTASRALTGSTQISAARRRAVEAAALDLGYRTNPVARALARGTGDQVVVVSPNAADEFLGRVVTGAAAEAQRWGAGVRLARMALSTAACWSALARDRSVAGVLAVNATAPDLADWPAQLLARTVTLGRVVDSVSSVDVDSVAATTGLLGHLLAAGRRRIVYVGPGLPLACMRRRLDTYRLVLAEAGLPATVLRCAEDAGGARAAVADLLASGVRPDAVMASSDLIAGGALAALDEAGYGVPGDVAVVGFDDAALSRFTRPALTTATNPGDESAALATAALLRGRAGGAEHTVVPTELRLRASA
jgi:DNA-binding LacI/PurR family transcriptional regulator